MIKIWQCDERERLRQIHSRYPLLSFMTRNITTRQTLSTIISFRAGLFALYFCIVTSLMAALAGSRAAPAGGPVH